MTGTPQSSWPGTGLLCTHAGLFVGLDLSVGLDPSVGSDSCVRAGGLLSTNNPPLLLLWVTSHHTHTKPLQGEEDPPRVLSQSPGAPSVAAGSVPLHPTDTQVPQTPTTLRGLIGAVTTVVVVVADKVLGDALPVPTHELPLITGIVVHCNGAPSPSPLAPASPQPPPAPHPRALTAASGEGLIGPVRTVLVPVTEPALRHTHVGAWALEGS